MAEKSKAQYRALLRAFANLSVGVRDWASGTFETLYDAALAAVEAADDQPEDIVQREALEALLAAAAAMYQAAMAAARTVHLSLGRYADAPNPADVNAALGFFNDKLVADNEAVESRGFTRDTFSAGGGNTGNGVVVVLNTDANGTGIDVGTVETETLICIRDAQTGGATLGQEVFERQGESLPDASKPWREGGSNLGATYVVPAGRSMGGSGPFVSRVATRELRALSAARGSGNIVPNGDMSRGLTGTAPTQTMPGWQRDGTGGTATLAMDTTQYVSSPQSLSVTDEADFVLFAQFGEPGVPRIDSGMPYLPVVFVRKDSDVTGGTVTLRVLDDSTTHFSATVDLSAISADTWVVNRGTPVWLPQGVGDNLRIELDLSNFARSGSGKVYIDEVRIHQGTQVDGRYVWISPGATAFRYNDEFTASTTLSEVGVIQTMMNLAYGKAPGAALRGYLEHVEIVSTLDPYWSDDP